MASPLGLPVSVITVCVFRSASRRRFWSSRDWLVVAGQVAPAVRQPKELDWFAGSILELAVRAHLCLHAQELVLDGDLVGAAASALRHGVQLHLRGRQLLDGLPVRQAS
jgi:hypothetical protein